MNIMYSGVVMGVLSVIIGAIGMCSMNHILKKHNKIQILINLFAVFLITAITSVVLFAIQSIIYIQRTI